MLKLVKFTTAEIALSHEWSLVIELIDRLHMSYIFMSVDVFLPLSRYGQCL